jgi:hypothetical protein
LKMLREPSLEILSKNRDGGVMPDDKIEVSVANLNAEPTPKQKARVERVVGFAYPTWAIPTRYGASLLIQILDESWAKAGSATLVGGIVFTEEWTAKRMAKKPTSVLRLKNGATISMLGSSAMPVAVKQVTRTPITKTVTNQEEVFEAILVVRRVRGEP